MKGGRPLNLPQSVLPQNWGGTEPNRTVTWIVLKAAANDRRTTSTISMMNFEGLYLTPSDSYSRVFGDRPCNFEPWSSEEDDTPLLTSTPSQLEDVLVSTDLTCIDPYTVGLELLTHQSRVCYLHHEATTAILFPGVLNHLRLSVF
ncbi:hypothetical protein TNCV_2558291 [Trichonephila clavipes]|nr:hypothetical protein TNCV_2558291 [Trichonephila clavipes]